MQEKTQCSKPQPVILDHDGGIDDFVALAALCSSPDTVRLIGCIVIDADCHVADGYQTSVRLLALLGHSHVPTAMSTLTAVHPFPDPWRRDAGRMKDFSCFRRQPREPAVPSTQPGEELLAELVLNSPEPVTVVVTGPLSNIAYAIQKYGERFTSKVRSIVVMGGAVDVPGNVRVNNADCSAEWNLYWDAPSAATVLATPSMASKIILFSLDSTNLVPITREFVGKLTEARNEQFPLSCFVADAYGLAVEAGRIYGDGVSYYAWDVLTAAFTVHPSIATLVPCRLRVVATKDAPNEGQTVRDEQQGVVVLVAMNPDAERFYEFVLSLPQKFPMAPLP